MKRLKIFNFKNIMTAIKWAKSQGYEIIKGAYYDSTKDGCCPVIAWGMWNGICTKDDISPVYTRSRAAEMIPKKHRTGTKHVDGDFISGFLNGYDDPHLNYSESIYTERFIKGVELGRKINKEVIK